MQFLLPALAEVWERNYFSIMWITFSNFCYLYTFPLPNIPAHQTPAFISQFSITFTYISGKVFTFFEEYVYNFPLFCSCF